MERFYSICPNENIYIVTNADYKNIVKENLPDIPEENILLEPMRKNTAPCIAFANKLIEKKNPNANIIVTPSDHLIINTEKFISIIKKGLDFIQNNDALLTIGIKPTRPETGYGYIQINSDEKAKKEIIKVKTFTEKPNYELAQFFVKSGEFFWNSGIFIWKLSAIDNAFKTHLPDVYHLFEENKNNLNDSKTILYVYTESQNISVDYGIMEKAENVYVIKADFDWSDLGTWGSLFENMPKDTNNNVIHGKNVFIQNSNNNFIHFQDNKIVVINSVSDLIIVEHNNMLLISDKNKEQDIKNIINRIDLK